MQIHGYVPVFGQIHEPVTTLVQIWSHSETVSGVASLQLSVHSRCLFSQRYKCLYKGKQIKLLKEKKDQNHCTPYQKKTV